MWMELPKINRFLPTSSPQVSEEEGKGEGKKERETERVRNPLSPLSSQQCLPIPSLPSPPPPPPLTIIINIAFINPLIVRALRRRRDGRERGRGQHFGSTFELFPLPLDFKQPVPAFAPDVLGDFDEAEDVFLFVRLWLAKSRTRIFGLLPSP